MHYFIAIKFQIASASNINRINECAPCANESQHNNDESVYKNMVGEMRDPINCEFCSGNTNEEMVDNLKSK